MEARFDETTQGDVDRQRRSYEGDATATERRHRWKTTHIRCSYKYLDGEMGTSCRSQDNRLRVLGWGYWGQDTVVGTQDWRYGLGALKSKH